MPQKSDSSPENEDKVLDLLDTNRKPSRRQRQRMEAEAATAPSKLEKAKSEALDLFSEEKKPKVRKAGVQPREVLGSISKLLDRARESQVSFPATVSTPYINTIPRETEPWFPGDEHIERNIRRFVRWNAAAMVVNANKSADGIGGHLSTFASSASLPSQRMLASCCSRCLMAGAE